MIQSASPQHGDVPGDQSDALKRGRTRAQAIGARSLEPFAGTRPEPVRFDAADPDATGPGPAR